MKQGCRMQINSSPETVWRFLTDPELMKSWNGRIRAIVPVSQGQWHDGSRFRIRCRIFGQESNYLAEVLEYQEPERLVIHLSGGNLPPRGYAQEIYMLVRTSQGTILRQYLEIQKAGLHFYASAFYAWFTYFGRHSERRNLKRLKELIERGR